MEADLLTIDVTTSDGCALLRVIGEVDATNAHLLADAVTAAVASGPSEIELDCSAMAFIDSSGIRVLIEAWERIRPDVHMDIFVTKLQPGPARTLAICGVHDLLTR